MESEHQIETQNTAYFRHLYDCEHADMRRLYQQAKIDQWNAAGRQCHKAGSRSAHGRHGRLLTAALSSTRQWPAIVGSR
jgi:hypothetical protein